MKQIRWNGRGGHGGFTAARLLGLAASVFEDNYAQAFPSFGPERRGAPVLGFTRIDSKPILDHSQVYECDYVIVLDETLIDSVNVAEGLKDGAILLINSAKKPSDFKFAANIKVMTIDATKIALEVLKSPITNTTMLGAIVGASDIVKIESVYKAIDDFMPKELREKNKEAAKTAYNNIKKGAVS